MKFKCECGKEYKHQSNFSRHGKKCDTYQNRKLNKEGININNITNNFDYSTTNNIVVNININLPPNKSVWKKCI